MNQLTPLLARALGDEIERIARLHAERPQLPEGRRRRPWRRAR